MNQKTTVATAPPEAWAKTLALVFRDLPDPERDEQVKMLLEDARSGRVSMEGLFAVERAGNTVGAVFANVEAGRTGQIWPPRVVEGQTQDTARELLAAVVAWLKERQVDLVHALLPSGNTADPPLLLETGFKRLADLLYLVSTEEDFPRTSLTPPIEFEPYTPAAQDRLIRLVEATYEETLDCPALNGVRQTGDVLDGYRASGGKADDLWYIVRHQQTDVGCLLLADHPETENRELVYMGLMPSVRGNGWGQHIVRHAQWLTRTAGRPRLVLAVDAANTPATTMYALAGFRGWDRKTVYQMALIG